MNTYTVYAGDIEAAQTGLSTEAAAHELLGYDSAEYEIRPSYVSGHAKFNTLEAAKEYQSECLAEGDDEDRAEIEIEYEPKIDALYLWTRKQVANRPWSKTVIFSVEPDFAKAEAEIYQQVINSGFWESDNLSCMTDEAFAEMLAELETE